MPENPDVEVGGAGGDQPPVSPKAVEGQAAQLPELVKSVVKEVLAEELKPIKGEISGIYSRQDKDRNAFREFADEYRAQKAKGLSDSEAESAAQKTLDQRAESAAEKRMLKEVHERLVGSAQPSGKGASGTDESARLVAELQLNANDAKVIEILGEGDFITRAAKLASYKASLATNQSDPSAAPALRGGPPPPSEDIKTLTENYKRDMLAARGKPGELKAIKDKYIKMGVNIYGVDFT